MYIFAYVIHIRRVMAMYFIYRSIRNRHRLRILVHVSLIGANVTWDTDVDRWLVACGHDETIVMDIESGVVFSTMVMTSSMSGRVKGLIVGYHGCTRGSPLFRRSTTYV